MSESGNDSKRIASPQNALEQTFSQGMEEDLGIELADIDKVANAMAYFDQIRKHINSEKSDSEAAYRAPTDAGFDTTSVAPSAWKNDERSEQAQHGLPKHIARFEIEGVLGQGGFARVFLARDPKLDRKVALKVLNPTAVVSNEARLRFQREAHAAAILSHPNIVPVFESGSVGPIHFLVSEYCEGETLAHWFEDKKRKVVPKTAARIVARLAEAVQHAHQRGVVHRDLKPGNILLQSQENSEDFLDCFRITDFGLARFSENDLNTLTTDGAIVGTPAYMSPEQACGDKDIGHATDVFSLGVILYELLTGKLPFRGDNHISTLRLVEDAKTVAPRNINSDIARDLEAICLRALEKQPTDRYETAHEFGQDLTRWLGGLPVQARPIRPHEKAWRWCKRNPHLAAALSFAFLSFAIGLALTTWKWLEADRNMIFANRETKRANDEAQTAKDETARANKLSKRTNDALEAFKFAFASATPQVSGKANMSAREVLEKALEYLPLADFDDEGKLIFYDALLDSFQGIEELQKAAEIAETSLRLTEKVHGKNSSKYWYMRARYARIFGLLDRNSESLELMTDFVEHQHKIEPGKRYFCLFVLGQAKFHMGFYSDSIEPLQTARDWFVEFHGKDHRQAIEMTIHLGLCHLHLENTEPAARLLNQAYDVTRSVYSDDDVLTIFAKQSIGELHQSNGDFKLGIEFLQEAADDYAKMFGVDHAETLSANTRLAFVLMRDKQFESAIRLIEQVVRRSDEKLRENHSTTIEAKLVLGAILTRLRKLAQATEIFEKLLEQYKGSRWRQLGIRSELGRTYLAQGQKTRDKNLCEAALSIFEENFAELTEMVPDDHEEILITEHFCTQALMVLNDFNAAESVAVKLLAKLKKKYPSGDDRIGAVTNSLATCYSLLGQIDDAMVMYREIIASLKTPRPKGDTKLVMAMINLGTMLNKKDRFSEAQEILSEALSNASKNIPDETFVVNLAKNLLAIAHRGCGEPDQAIELLEEVLAETGFDPRMRAEDPLRKCYIEKRDIENYLRIAEISLDGAKRIAGTTNKSWYSGYIIGIAKEMMELELYDRATEVYRESLDIRTKLDSEAWFTFNTMSLLGESLFKTGQFEDAKPLLEEGCLGLKKTCESVPQNQGSQRAKEAVQRLLELANAELDNQAIERWSNELQSMPESHDD